MNTSDDKQATAVAREVAAFYARFPFPGDRQPDADGLLLMRRIASLIGDLQRTANVSRPRLLDAGCGTGNTSVALARTFGGLEVFGVDICGRSIAVARESAAGLDNVCFMHADLVTGPLPKGPWHIVVCLGVLHHTADMDRALAHLTANLAPQGRLLLWVYGRHGRYRHELNRRLLRLLLADETDPAVRVDLARQFACGTARGEPLRDLYGFVPGGHARERVVLGDAWIADQFLNDNERSLDLPELLDLLDRAGLTVDEWLGVTESPDLQPPALADRLASLPQRDRLIATDLLLKPPRYFVCAGRKGE